MHVQRSYEIANILIPSLDTLLTFWMQKICFLSVFRHRKYTIILFHKIYGYAFQIANDFESIKIRTVHFIHYFLLRNSI